MPKGIYIRREETRRKMSEMRRGLKTGFDAIAVADKRIRDEIIALEKQGFRCVPVGGKVRPDIVAVKNGKIFAVEVEFRKANPDYSKYKDEIRNYFDDIIWILKDPRTMQYRRKRRRKGKGK